MSKVARVVLGLTLILSRLASSVQRANGRWSATAFEPVPIVGDSLPFQAAMNRLR